MFGSFSPDFSFWCEIRESTSLSSVMGNEVLAVNMGVQERRIWEKSSERECTGIASVNITVQQQ